MKSDEKVVIILGADEVLEKEGFYELLREKNYKIAAVSKEFSTNKADYYIKLDVTNIDVVISELVKFREEHEIALIFSVSEFGVETAAVASSVLGIKYGTSLVAVKRARNKYLTRQILRDNNIPTPKFFLAKSKKEIIDNIDKVEFPIIIKPLDAAGSCSVTQINTLEQLNEKIDFAFDNRDSMPVNDHRVDKTREYWIVEEYLDGIEISVECCTFDKETTVMAIHDKYCDVCEPYFIERTFVTPPPRFSKNQIKEIEDMAKKVLAAIGYDYGISHVEMKVTKKGPRLLEVNARMGGGLNMESVLRSTGISVLKVLLEIREGKKPEININERKNVAFRLVTSNEGKVTEINGFEDAKKIDGVEISIPTLKVGDIVKARQANYGGFILAEGKNVDELLDCLDRAEERIEIKTINN